MSAQRLQTLIIGAGQAGLSVGYHLQRRGLPFLIVEAQQRIGDNWRQRWDSLRLFTPARLNSLDGMRFPGPGFAFPTKDEFADYLESYAAHFQLPVRTGVRVERVTRHGDHFDIHTNDGLIEADNVVVAMAKFQRPHVPSFAGDLDPRIVQLHSSEYRNPTQLRPGDVLIAGAGTSGGDIAIEAVRDHRTWLAGRDVGQVPFAVEGTASRLFLSRFMFRVVLHRVLTIDTPIGRRVRPKVLHGAGPLVRVRSKDLAAAGVTRAPRVVGARNGLPLLEDDRVLDVANIVWCTGFHPGFSWIELPVCDDHGLPIQQRGVVTQHPGLYFVGMHFQYALSSTMVHGVGRDADYVARVIATRTGRNVSRTSKVRALSRAAAL